MNCSVSWCVSVATDGQCCPVHQKYPVHHSGETVGAWRERVAQMQRTAKREAARAARAAEKQQQAGA